MRVFQETKSIGELYPDTKKTDKPFNWDKSQKEIVDKTVSKILKLASGQPKERQIFLKVFLSQNLDKIHEIIMEHQK